MSTAERTDDVLVGRSDVLDHLTELRASAGSGGLAVLVSEGEAGIGKTALARSATQRSKVHVIAWGQILSVEAKYCDSRPQGLGGLQLLLGSGVLLARPVAAAHTASPG
jgi:hypothetical protein